MAKFDLITTLTLNAQGFEGGINKAKQATKELSDNIKGSTDVLGSLGGAMGGITGDMTNAISSLAGAATGIGLVVAAVGLLASAFKTAKENVDLYLASVDKSKQGEGIFTQQAGDIIGKNIKRESGGVTTERMIELKTGAEMAAIDIQILAARVSGNKELIASLQATRATLKEQNEQAHTIEKTNQEILNGDRSLSNRIPKEVALKKVLLEQYELQKESAKEVAENIKTEADLKKYQAIIGSADAKPAEKKAAMVAFEELSNSYAARREDHINRQIANVKALGTFTGDEIGVLNEINKLEAERANVGKTYWAEQVKENKLLRTLKKDALAEEIAAEKKKRAEEKKFSDDKLKNLLIEGGGTGIKVGGEYYDKNSKLQKAGMADASNLKAKNLDFGLATGSQITEADKALRNYGGTLKSTIDLNNQFAESQERIQNAVESFSSSISQGADSFKEFGKNVASSMKQAISALLSATIAQAIQKSVAFAKNPLIGIALGAIAGGLAATLFKSLVPKFSEGGIVGGTSYEGDRVPIMVNSGERVLTMNQQANMMGGGVLTTKISGTDLMIVLNNTQRRNNNFR